MWSKIKQNWILVLIFILATALRLFAVEQRFYFGIDEEYQSLLGLSLIKDFHLVWIGTSQSNTGFYLGPGMVYLHALLLYLSRLNPLILAYSASLVGILVVFVLSYITSQIFDKKGVLIALLIYAFSSFILFYDRRFWNPTFIPLLSLLFFLAINFSKKQPLYYLLLAGLLGLTLHVHASLFVFFPVVLTELSIRAKAGKKIASPKIFFWSLTIFVLTCSPLIVFDFVHNFDNLRTPLRILQSAGTLAPGKMLIDHIQVMAQTLLNFLVPAKLPSIINLVLILLLLIGNCYYFTRKKGAGERIVSLIVAWYFFWLLFFPGTINDYYYLGILPYEAMVIAFFLRKVDYRILALMLVIFFYSNVNFFLNNSFSGGLKVKRELILKVNRVVLKRPFRLSTTHDYLYFGGWRYLFEAYGNTPVQSQADGMFGWIYSTEISSKTPAVEVVISENNLIPEGRIHRTIKRYPFTAYVIKE